MSPFVPGDYSEQLKILVICSIVCGIDSYEAAAKTPVKHSLPAIRGKRKRQERLGSLTKRYRSADKAQ